MRGTAINRRRTRQRHPIVSGHGTLRISVQADTRGVSTNAYVIIDVYSRYIISAQVYEADNAEYAKVFLSEAFKKQGVRPGTLVVHSDNGASMKDRRS